MAKKKKTFLWQRTLISILSVSAVLSLIWASFCWSRFKGSLSITDVKFTETDVLDTHIYRAVLGEIIGTSSDQVSLREIGDLIESHPYVKAARISHHYPGIIKVEIKERKPIALLKTDPMVLLDREGFVLPDVGNLNNYNLPIMTNFNPEPELYPAGEMALSVKVKDCISWLSRIHNNYTSLYNNLSELKMTSTNEMELILSDHPTHIYLGQDKVWSRINTLKQFEKKLQPKKISDISYLDMRYENQIIAKGRHS